MLAVALIVLATAGAWALAAVGFALLTGGMIKIRDRRDVRCGGVRVARPVARLAVAPVPRPVAQLASARGHR
ncbi:hypothetical protein [Amnibacterium kyonggiense]